MAEPGALLNIASGLLMSGLGVALLLANPRKDWNRVFGLFAMFWGIQIVSLNAVRVATHPEVALLAGRVGVAFLLPLYFFLAAFASIFPRPRPPFGTSGLSVAALAAPAGLALTVLFAAPEALIEEVGTNVAGRFTMVWGPAFPWLVSAPFFAALLYAILAMARRLPEATTAIERKQVTCVLAALAVYAAYQTPGQLLTFGLAALGLREASEAEAREAALFALIMLANLLLLAALSARLATRARRAPDRDARREAGWVLGAVVLSFAAGAAVAVAAPRLELLGLVRSASVALIGYAIVRYQLFDVDLRVKAGATFAAPLLAGVALGAAAWVVLQDAQVAPALGGALAAALAVLAYVPLLRVATRLADRVAPGVSTEGPHLHLRKLEVYRAAVESLQQRGEPAAVDAPALRDLRAKLGLTELDHEAAAGPSIAAPSLRPGSVAFGKYVVERVLGEGAFGRAVLARDRILERPVVLKELLARWRSSPEVVARFLQEARIAGQLTHPNVVAVYEVERRGEDHYVVMEHVPGGSLADRLAEGPLAWEEAAGVARGVLAGLAAAHAAGVVHRDVKPANVLLDGRGGVKVADFGIAQLAGEEVEPTVSGLTLTGFQPGTLQYMSPEQATGQSVDARSDLYAVGALLFRMLTGKPHLDLKGLDELSARAAIARAGPPPAIAGVPDELNRALARALAPEREKRFGSAGEFLAALPG